MIKEERNIRFLLCQALSLIEDAKSQAITTNVFYTLLKVLVELNVLISKKALWEDIDRTYTPNERQLDTLLDCMFGQFMTANRGQ